MNLIKNIFGNTESQKVASNLNWNNLSENSQFDEIIALSKTNLVLIFKHSTRCSISKMVLKRFENDYSQNQNISLYFLDLLEYRSISNEIASFFNVVHQSPQILVIKNEKCIYHSSHSDIQAEEIVKFV